MDRCVEEVFSAPTGSGSNGEQAATTSGTEAATRIFIFRIFHLNLIVKVEPKGSDTLQLTIKSAAGVEDPRDRLGQQVTGQMNRGRKTTAHLVISKRIECSKEQKRSYD